MKCKKQIIWIAHIKKQINYYYDNNEANHDNLTPCMFILIEVLNVIIGNILIQCNQTKSQLSM